MNLSLNDSGLKYWSNSHEVLWNRFLVLCFLSAVYLSVLAVLTTLANGVLLIALYQDPFKVFRQPPTIFITGLAVADFLTGLAVDPLFAYFYFEVYRDTMSAERYNNILKAAGVLSSVTMNVSILTILFLSWTQFIAISFPHRHKQLVTGKRVLVCVCGIWAYSLLFSSSLLMGVPEKAFQKIDVFLNLTLIHLLVLFSYIALQVSYRRQLGQLNPLQANTITSIQLTDAWEHRRRKDQRHFFVISLLLATCLLLFVAPVTVMWYVTLYYTPQTYEGVVKATMANVITDANLFLKFLIDPFIYAWRLPKFRQAVKAIFSKRRSSNMDSITMVSFNLRLSRNQIHWNSLILRHTDRETYRTKHTCFILSGTIY